MNYNCNLYNLDLFYDTIIYEKIYNRNYISKLKVLIKDIY